MKSEVRIVGCEVMERQAGGPWGRYDTGLDPYKLESEREGIQYGAYVNGCVHREDISTGHGGGADSITIARRENFVTCNTSGCGRGSRWGTYSYKSNSWP